MDTIGWYKHYNKEMPVTMEYLKKLCDAVCPTLDTSVKSELGIRLRTYIDNHDSNVEIGNSMLLVLSGSNVVTASDGRRAILGLLKGLGTKFAFMLPKSMSELLGRVDVIHTGAIVMATKNASDGVIGLGSGHGCLCLSLPSAIPDCEARYPMQKTLWNTLPKYGAGSP
jgi:hypothetical protein